MRGVIYSDESKEAKLILDEEIGEIDLEDLISCIKNNQKSLSYREEDMLNFSKDIFLTGFGYIIKDIDGKLVHNS